jgi:hypothetical protein
MELVSTLRALPALALLATWVACTGRAEGRPDGAAGDDDRGASSSAPQAATAERRFAGIAELPRYTVEIPPLGATGRTIQVPAGGNLQRAIDRAGPGDAIVLAPGATYRGPFTLRRKEGDGWIVIRSGAPDAALPAEGERISPSHAARLPRLVTTRPDQSVIYTEPGAAGYRLVALEVTADRSVRQLNALIRLGDGAADQGDETPSRLILDRMYVHGHGQLNLQRCVMLNSAWSAVVHSHLSECHGAGFDSQAIVGWNGPGPYRIENNYLEGAGEVVMFGGAEPGTPNLIPGDIEIRRNHVRKPPEWRQAAWSIKNLLELKFARRVLIEANVFEGNWRQAQTGYAILLKSSADVAWAVTEDVTIRLNRIHRVGAGFALNGKEGAATQSARRIRLENNLLYDVNTAEAPGDGRLLLVANGIDGLQVEHNTLVSNGPLQALLVLDHAPAVHRFTFRFNIATLGEYGIKGSGTAVGIPSLQRFAPGAAVTGNLLVGTAGPYPGGNTFVRAARDLAFAGPQSGDFRLVKARLAPDGRALGVDMAALDSALRVVTRR